MDEEQRRGTTRDIGGEKLTLGPGDKAITKRSDD